MSDKTMELKLGAEKFKKEMNEICKRIYDTFAGDPRFEWKVFIGYDAKKGGGALVGEMVSEKATLSNAESDIAKALFEKEVANVLNAVKNFSAEAHLHISDILFLYSNKKEENRFDFHGIPK